MTPNSKKDKISILETDLKNPMKKKKKINEEFESNLSTGLTFPSMCFEGSQEFSLEWNVREAFY